MAEAVIDSSLRIEGLIETSESLLVEGRVQGRIAAGGHVTIAAGASCRASIRSPRLTIVGELIGNAICTETIDVAPGARVVGDLRAPDVQVGVQAEVDGRVDVLPPEPTEQTIERQAVSPRGLGPLRPSRPQSAEFARKIPVPPRPSGRVRLSSRDAKSPEPRGDS